MRERQYFLNTPRLGFRAWSESDLDLAVSLWGDPEVARLIGGPYAFEEIADRLALEISLQQDYGVQYWPVLLLESGEHVGCCGLRPYHPPGTRHCAAADCHPARPWEAPGATPRVYELGFHVRSGLWRRGYAYEAASAVIAFAFGALGASALFAGHHPANEPSRQLLLSLGFRETHEEYYAPTGLNHPSYLLERLPIRASAG